MDGTRGQSIVDFLGGLQFNLGDLASPGSVLCRQHCQNRPIGVGDRGRYRVRAPKPDWPIFNGIASFSIPGIWAVAPILLHPYKASFWSADACHHSRAMAV